MSGEKPTKKVRPRRTRVTANIRNFAARFLEEGVISAGEYDLSDDEIEQVREIASRLRDGRY